MTHRALSRPLTLGWVVAAIVILRLADGVYVSLPHPGQTAVDIGTVVLGIWWAQLKVRRTLGWTR